MKRYWNDPDNGECSKWVTVIVPDEKPFDDQVVSVVDEFGGCLEVYWSELTRKEIST